MYITYRDFAPAKIAQTTVMCELWHRLPPGLEFKEIKTKEGDTALCVDTMSAYVYVPPDTVKAIKKGTPVLFALGTRHEGNMDFFYVGIEPAGSISERQNQVRAYNEAQILQAQKGSRRGYRD